MYETYFVFKEKYAYLNTFHFRSERSEQLCRYAITYMVSHVAVTPVDAEDRYRHPYPCDGDGRVQPRGSHEPNETYKLYNQSAGYHAQRVRYDLDGANTTQRQGAKIEQQVSVLLLLSKKNTRVKFTATVVDVLALTASPVVKRLGLQPRQSTAGVADETDKKADTMQTHTLRLPA